MQTGAFLTGPFGQSQALFEARSEVKMRRSPGQEIDFTKHPSVVQQALNDTRQVIQLQQKAGLDFIIDPMFHYLDIFYALSRQVTGVTPGPQENWFNNNVFYQTPQIRGPLSIQPGFTENYIHLDELPKDGRAMAILPSPYTLLALSKTSGYSSEKEAICNLAELLKAEAQHLASRGIARIQYDEPAIVVKSSLGSLKQEDLDLLRIGIDICGRIQGATTSVHTYFGDAGQIIPFLLSMRTDCIGIDCTETGLPQILRHDFSRKELSLGLVDARNTGLENPYELADQLREVANVARPSRLWLTTNTATEYRGFTHAKNKLELLATTKRVFNE